MYFNCYYLSAVQGAQQLILTLVDGNGNEVKVNLRPDDTPDDFFGDFVAGGEPTNTITFDFNTQKESTWNIETSQQALKVLNKVQEARLTWYKLEGIGKIMLFSYFHLHFSYNIYPDKCILQYIGSISWYICTRKQSKGYI